jgi:hypothetical protein
MFYLVVYVPSYLPNLNISHLVYQRSVVTFEQVVRLIGKNDYVMLKIVINTNNNVRYQRLTKKCVISTKTKQYLNF